MYHMFKAMPCLLPDWINVFLKLGDRVGYVAYEQFSKLDAQVIFLPTTLTTITRCCTRTRR